MSTVSSHLDTNSLLITFSSKSNKNIILKINKDITDFLTRPYIVIIVYIRSEKAHSSLQTKYLVFSWINVRLIKSISLSFIRWWGNVVYSAEKSYVDNLEAWKVIDLNLLRTSLEFLIDQK